MHQAHLTHLVAPGAAGAWLLGALHTHTVHSTGTLTPPALMQQFAAAGFDFVAITDDNNTTHRRDLQKHPRRGRC